MRIVYHCYGGTHSSVVAAALHLGRLPAERLPTPEELLALDLFDRTEREEHGRLFFMGKDAAGHEVYVVGLENSVEMVRRFLHSLARIHDLDEEEMYFVNALQKVNFWMRVGGYLSRALGFTRVGRPLVIYGVRRAYPALVELVHETRRQTSRAAATEGPAGQAKGSP